MIFLGTYKAGATVKYRGNFHSDQGTVENPTSPEAQREDPAGSFTSLTAPAQINSKTGHYGGSIDTTGFASGQHIVRMAGTVSTAKVTATEFCFEIVAYDPTDPVRLGLTAIPNAVPGAAGGLFIAGANAATSIATALTANIIGNITGNLSGSVASVTAGVTLAASAVQAIWDALTSALSTVGSIGKLIVDRLDAAISSRMAGSVPAEQIQSISEGGTVIRHRGDHWEVTIDGLESMTGNTKLWLTVKASKSHTDAEAAFQIIKGTGLTYLNGSSPVSPVVTADGSVTDEDEETISIVLKARANKDLEDRTFYYDVQILDADANPKTVGQGKWVVTADVTRATS